MFGGWGLGVGASIFCIGVLGNGIFSVGFCPEIPGRAAIQGLFEIKLAGEKTPCKTISCDNQTVQHTYLAVLVEYRFIIWSNKYVLSG